MIPCVTLATDVTSPPPPRFHQATIPKVYRLPLPAPRRTNKASEHQMSPSKSSVGTEQWSPTFQTQTLALAPYSFSYISRAARLPLSRMKISPTPQFPPSPRFASGRQQQRPGIPLSPDSFPTSLRAGSAACQQGRAASRQKLAEVLN